MVEVNAIEISPSDHAKVLDGFNNQIFTFAELPQRGDQAVLHAGRLGLWVLYQVESLRHEGCAPEAPRAVQPRITILVSRIRVMQETI